jgi:hypothetical protein
MRFDVSGSQLFLDGFRVVGETATYEHSDWNARLEIEKGELVWQKPLHLEDARPDHHQEYALSIKPLSDFSYIFRSYFLAH